MISTPIGKRQTVAGKSNKSFVFKDGVIRGSPPTLRNIVLTSKLCNNSFNVDVIEISAARNLLESGYQVAKRHLGVSFSCRARIQS